MKRLAYISICILYFAVFFVVWIFVIDHLCHNSANVENSILAIIVTIVLFFLWIISANSLSFILDRMLDINRRKYVQTLRQKYANLSDRELYDRMWEYKRSLSSFSPFYPDYEKELERQKISDECQDILEIRKQDQLIGYLKSNILIWIVISIIAFYLGYVW